MPKLAKTYRHGDVLLMKVAALPADAKKVTPGPRGYVLAEGEVTGHAHTIEAVPGIELYERDGVLYVTVADKAVVDHEEHNRTKAGATPVLDKPGVYRSVGQQTWSAGRATRVLD